jgi:hypothetical protein
MEENIVLSNFCVNVYNGSKVSRRISEKIETCCEESLAVECQGVDQ